MQWFVLFLVMCLVAVIFDESVGKRTKRKHRTEVEDDVDELTYVDKEDFDSKIRKMKEKSDNLFEVISPEKRSEMEKEEFELRKNLIRASLNHGEISREKANALHILGRNLYKRGKYEDVLSISREITKIHEALDGPEHIKTADALGNVGATAFRLGFSEECELAMNRALYIIIKEYGPESKEVTLFFQRNYHFF